MPRADGYLEEAILAPNREAGGHKISECNSACCNYVVFSYLLTAASPGENDALPGGGVVKKEQSWRPGSLENAHRQNLATLRPATTQGFAFSQTELS